MEHEPPLEFTVRVAIPKLAALKGGDTENSADMDLDIGLSGLLGDFVPFLNGGSEPGAFVSEALELFFNDPFSLGVIGDFPFRQQLGDAGQEGVTLLAVLIAMLSRLVLGRHSWASLVVAAGLLVIGGLCRAQFPRPVDQPDQGIRVLLGPLGIFTGEGRVHRVLSVTGTFLIVDAG